MNSHQWPERIWSTVADAMARHAAEHGDYGPPENAIPPSGPFSRDPSCDRCNYGAHRCKGCGEPLPHGTEACAGCDDAWGGQRPSASYAEWRREGLTREEGRILAGAYGPDEVIPLPEACFPAGFAYRELTDAEEAAENATWD